MVAYAASTYVLDDSIITQMTNVPVVLSMLSRKSLETMTGNMLGDGSVGYRNGKASGNARFAMTMSVKAHDYLLYLANGVYSQFSDYVLNPYPNVSLPQHAGKVITQYYFQTRSLPVFTALHAL